MDILTDLVLKPDERTNKRKAQEILKQIKVWLKNGYSKITKQTIIENFKGCSELTAKAVIKLLNEEGSQATPRKIRSSKVLIICDSCGRSDLVLSGSEASVRNVCNKCVANEVKLQIPRRWESKIGDE